MKECKHCNFLNEYGMCTCPPQDRWYNCQIEAKKPENEKALEEYAAWSNHNSCRCCGACKHWHKWENDAGELARGDCDRIAKGKVLSEGTTYSYDGYSFEDECYDEIFGCFEAST